MDARIYEFKKKINGKENGELACRIKNKSK